MNITIRDDLTRTYSDERGDRKVVHFVLTDDNDVSYNCVDDLPADVNAQEYLETNIEKELLFVRYEEYKIKPEIRELAEFEQWIADGCKIVVGKDAEDNDVTIRVEKQNWRQRF